METLDEMLLCMPCRHGGYGLKRPAMNHVVPFDEQARRISGLNGCRVDICYPDIHLAIEHQGAGSHAGKDEFDSDRARINALKATGFEVIELTAGQVRNLQVFEEIALLVASRLGQRVRTFNLGAIEARIALRRSVYGLNHRFGHPKS